MSDSSNPKAPCAEPDCDLDAATHAEIAEVLQADAPDVFARADLAADAIDLATSEALARTPRRGFLRPALAAAALVLALVGGGIAWLHLRDAEPPAEVDQAVEDDDGEGPVEPPPTGSVLAERKANEAFLADPATQARIAKVEDGQWIGIQHGKTMVVADELGKLDVLLKRAEREGVGEQAVRMRPRALHRFTFQKGSEGDRTYKTFFGRPPFVGAAFINRFMFHVSMGNGKVEYALVKDGKVQGKPVVVHLSEGKGAELPMHIGEPTSLGGVEVAVGYSTGSTNPLVLPDGMGFPRFEVPGTASLEGGGGHRSFRRYIASISIPRMNLREVFVEAMGRPEVLEQEDGSLRLGGATWQPYGDEVLEAARKAGKPVLLLERQRWMHGFPGNPFARSTKSGVRAALERYTLLWRELPDRTTWVGSGDAAPPAESRLSCWDPRDGGGDIRHLVVRPWTSHREIVTFFAVTRRRFELGPTEGVKQIWKNESDVVRALASIHRAQATAAKRALIDTDGDGLGEYATLRELTGGRSTRRKEPIRPPLLPNAFAPKPEHLGDLRLAGYRIRLYLPGHRRTAIPMTSAFGGRGEFLSLGTSGGWYTRSVPGPEAVDMAKAETHWWAYAWPEELEVTGRRTFYIDQDGQVWATAPRAGAYEGTQSPPAPDAAFAAPGRYPGGVSPALRSADGNRWRTVP